MAEFTCFKCHVTFAKRNDAEWNDKKAAEEFLTLYPETKNDPTDILCDYCNDAFKIWFSQFTDEEKKKMRDDFYNTCKTCDGHKEYYVEVSVFDKPLLVKCEDCQ